MPENLFNNPNPLSFNRADFGDSFSFGVSTSAYQTEGSHRADGKGPSIWDVFVTRRGSIYKGHKGDDSCEFYLRYEEDLLLMHRLNIKNFRFSLSWSRIIPDGTGKRNIKGIAFYNRVIDKCLELGIVPWVTLYHWDLPQVLEQKGGWTNRDIIGWFKEYTAVCVREFGDRVKHWMVLNEPLVFVGAGYFLGVHAPGRKGMKNFLPALHHAAICQGEGARVIKYFSEKAQVGTTFSCSHIVPLRTREKDVRAAARVNALVNRLFIEPTLGLGYPEKELKFLKRMDKYWVEGDEELLKFDFDFIGLQNYTQEIVKHSCFIPYMQATLVKAEKRNVPVTLMKWEVAPQSIYHMLKQFDAYKGIKNIVVTENGAAFPDVLQDERIDDVERKNYITAYLSSVLRARREGVKVNGYFIWTFTDNFEWAEGFYPRFGLVYVDFRTQQRIVKSSGRWYKAFLQ